jgi:hypothetical protein
MSIWIYFSYTKVFKNNATLVNLDVFLHEKKIAFAIIVYYLWSRNFKQIGY